MVESNTMRIGAKNIPATDRLLRHDYRLFYEQLFGYALREAKYPFYMAFCPFHKDQKTPNFRINIISGSYFCWACGASGGYYNFVVKPKPDGTYAYHLPMSLTESAEIQRMVQYEQSAEYAKECSELDLKVDEHRAIKAHELLFQQPLALQILHRDRGLTDETIRKYRIGFLGGIFTIPIYDYMGKLATLKFHKRWQTAGAKNQLHPWTALASNKPMVILCEGEFDMMVLDQRGFNAVTQTAGANGWNPEFAPLFRNRVVYVAYDNDEAGRLGAVAVGRSLLQHGISVYQVQWPSFMQNKEDHVDYFVKYKQQASDYQLLLKQATNMLDLIK